jgi:outer membrane protein
VKARTLFAHLLTACAALGGAAALGLLHPESAAAAGPLAVRLAVVDIRRAVFETEDGLRAQATLRKYSERRQAEIMTRREEFERRKDDLGRQSKLLSKDALQRSMDDLQRQMNEIEARAAKQSEVAAPIYGRIADMLSKVARRDGYDVILDKQAVPYAKTEYDITDMVITMYNAGDDGSGPARPAITPTAAPGAAASPAASGPAAASARPAAPAPAPAPPAPAASGAKAP